MTAMPQLVAAFHSLVGLAAVLVAAAAYLNPDAFGILGGGRQYPHGQPDRNGAGRRHRRDHLLGLGHRFPQAQRQHVGAPIMLPARHVINLGTLVAIIGLIGAYAVSTEAGPGENMLFWIIVAAAFVIGFLLIIPIGGADMPVVVSMLNSYSGWAAAAMGFTLHNTAMIITGALVGSSGAILSYIMCRAMNRSFISVIAGGFGAESGGGGGAAQDRAARGSAAARKTRPSCSRKPNQVIIIPGYGMAVAQAQHALREMGDMLKEAGRQREIRHPSGRGPHAGAHERAAGRSQRAL